MPAPLEIVRSDRAKRDLLSIYKYVAAEASPEIAHFVIAALFEGIQRAAAHTLSFRERLDREGPPRRISVFTYAVLYQPLIEGEGIYVLGIVQGPRDLRRQIANGTQA